MELAPYVETLRRDLAAAAAPAGPDIVRAADLLGTALEASARMGLLEALSDAAAEITTKLNQASVEVRLRGREAQFVVTETTPADMTPPVTSPTPPSPDAETGDIARMTLRLPEGVKEAVERAAAAEGISVNAWLVRAITTVVSGQPPWPPSPPNTPPPGGWGERGRGGGRRLTGYAQA
jgi:hypothetical protein